MEYYSHPMMNSDHFGWGILMAAFWLVVFLIVVLVVMRHMRTHHLNSSQKIDPLDIAKERFAKGEITKEEFHEIQKELK